MFIVPVWVFSSRSSIVLYMGRYGMQVTSDDPRRKNVWPRSPGILVAIWFFLCTQFITWEELKFCPSPVQWCGAASCWQENWHCAVSGVLSTYISDAWFKNWRCRLVFTSSSSYTGPRKGCSCVVDHSVVLVLVWWCASTVIWWLSCSQCVVLCQLV